MLRRVIQDLFAKIRWRDAGPLRETLPGATADADSMFRECVRLSDSGQLDQAFACYGEMLALYPRHARALNNLGVIHQRRGDLTAAIGCFAEAIRVDSLLAEPHVNIGSIHDAQGDLDSAVVRYRRAIGIDPQHVLAHCSLGQVLLARGEYHEGWREYEWRWKAGHPQLKIPSFPQPLWEGLQDIGGKRMLLHMEQGYGDAIQFVRYAASVAARNAEVVVACDRALQVLFRSVPGVSSVIGTGQALPDFDYHIPLMSLPRAFRTTIETIPAELPYLFADPVAASAWRKECAPYGSSLRVGLVWKGNPAFIAARSNACPVSLLRKLVDTPNCVFFSLQKGAAAAEIRELAGGACPVIDRTAALENFADTAALIAALDVVVTVDTAVAHLAGALGKPVWVMVPVAPDWRWLPAGGAHRWYPTVRVFRQTVAGEWDGVVNEVTRLLAELAAEQRERE